MSWLTGDLVIVPLRGAVSDFASESAQLVVCDQGTEEWHRARIGKPTGSKASSIVTPLGKPRTGKTVDQLAYKLAMDRVYGRDQDEYISKSMELGNLIEPEARSVWEKVNGVQVEQVGFVYGDDSKKHGASPDGLFVLDGKLGVIEIKSLQRNATCAALSLGDDFKIPPDHHAQLQFNMWECGATIGVYINYFSSDIAPILLTKEVGIDDALFAGFEAAIPQFCDKIDEAESRIIAHGKFVKDSMYA